MTGVQTCALPISTYGIGPNGQTNNVTVASRSRTDPLEAKQVIQESDFWGMDLNILGNQYISPAKVKVGHGRETWITNPTGLSQVYAAPLGTARGGNQSWFSQSDTEAIGTGTNGLPDEAYGAPPVSYDNPLVTGQFGASNPNIPTAPGTKSATGTNAVAKPK